MLDSRKSVIDIHRRLCDGDRSAEADLTRCRFVDFVDQLAIWLPQQDAALLHDGVAQIFRAFCGKPGQFQPRTERSLKRFLLGAAFRNVLHLNKSEVRRHSREHDFAARNHERSVAEDPMANSIKKDDEAEALARATAAVHKARADLPEEDREPCRLLLIGVRGYAPYARALNIAHLPPAEQRRLVKRVKDRLVAYLEKRGLKRLIGACELLWPPEPPA